MLSWSHEQKKMDLLYRWHVYIGIWIGIECENGTWGIRNHFGSLCQCDIVQDIFSRYDLDSLHDLCMY